MLIVDDHEDVRVFLRAVLADHEFTIVAVGTGREAIAAAQQDVHAVVLDLGLPDMSGLDVLAEIRQLAYPPPVIVLTGDDGQDPAALLDQGAHDFIFKPPRLHELRARVTAAVRVKQLQDQLYEANRQLTELALTDALTGLPNRRYGTTELDRLVSSAERHGRPVCVLMADIDRFKSLNDTYGHRAGDSCLREVARRLGDAVRSSDLAVRWGGEEFLVLMPDASPQHAAEVAERIRAAVADPPIRTGEATLSVTMSVGWAMRLPAESGADCVARADGALYDAKRHGRNAVVGA